MHNLPSLQWNPTGAAVKFSRIPSNILCFLLGNTLASGVYMSTFRNTLSVTSAWAGRCEQNELGMSSFYSHLPAYEDGRDRMFRNVDI